MMDLVRKVFPVPLVSLALVIVWLLIVQAVSAGQVFLGTVLAIAIPWFSVRFQSSRPKFHRPALILKLIGIVLWDIVIANIEVARLVLGSPSRLRSQFVRLPIDLSDPRAITLLATIITLTPGTVAAELSADRRTLLIHSLHVTDSAALVSSIKQRYEARLKEIFECSNS
jgi:multicomponent K+:H+ antiporter subunit E